MKQHINSIRRVENHLRENYTVLTENTSDNEQFVDWDISVTGTTKNNRVTTYTVKPNNTYNNNKVCLEFGKPVEGQYVPSGIGSATSDFVILTFYDDRRLYMIERERLLEYTYALNNFPVPKYVAMDKNKCQLVLFDRPLLLQRCRVI